jgi:hypothetical protein
VGRPNLEKNLGEKNFKNLNSNFFFFSFFHKFFLKHFNFGGPAGSVGNDIIPAGLANLKKIWGKKKKKEQILFFIFS